MLTPRKPPDPAGERAFGSRAQAPCQGVLVPGDVNSVNLFALARDVRPTDKLARRRGLEAGGSRVSHTVCKVRVSFLARVARISITVVEMSPSGREMWWSECPRRARAPKARAQAHKRLGTISRRAAHRAAHGNASTAQPQTHRAKSQVRDPRPRAACARIFLLSTG